MLKLHNRAKVQQLGLHMKMLESLSRESGMFFVKVRSWEKVCGSDGGWGSERRPDLETQKSWYIKRVSVARRD